MDERRRRMRGKHLQRNEEDEVGRAGGSGCTASSGRGEEVNQASSQDRKRSKMFKIDVDQIMTQLLNIYKIKVQHKCEVFSKMI